MTGISIYQWIIILIVLWFFTAPIALIDILRSKFEGKSKFLWLAVILVLNFPGVLLYFLIGRKQKIKTL